MEMGMAYLKIHILLVSYGVQYKTAPFLSSAFAAYGSTPLLGLWSSVYGQDRTWWLTRAGDWRRHVGQR